ncbi:hypothetical protein AXF42_Ash016745 [Apostasia shenzhenica]|uniref:soluble epoxide hydrolase n=1 Tax=Apostasia shenzhenica TaxID=1088818 RepID=A0A2I0AQ64_9ASPA|nr:hypothetical protein AXF42_Ash016745 [Apostasia shenzhenica]
MEGGGIEHRTVELNGIKMHVAEKGEGPVVLLLHGFPELWYSWRHQILSLAARGYRAVAPDLRGYGDTDAPADAAAYTIFHLVGDLVALIDFLGQDQKVFVVGHDWGALLAWHLCLFRPEKVKAVVCLSVPFFPRHPAKDLVAGFREAYGDDVYNHRFQEPGEAEAIIAQHGIEPFLKWFLTYRVTEPFMVSKEKGFKGFHDVENCLPDWLSHDDINYFASKFIESGFTGGINYYRNLKRNWELTSPWNGAQVKVPAKFITGDLDLVYHFIGVKDYIYNGGFKRDVPLLDDDVVVIKGVAHFINQEKPEEISNLIYEFIHKF